MRFLPALLLLLVSAPGASQEIFSDGFETGDASAWSRVQPVPDCGLGLAPTSLLNGDLGPAPAGAFDELACLEVSNDRDHERTGELADSGVPIARDDDLLDAEVDGLVLVGPGGRRVAAQFEVLSRWGGPLDQTSLPVRWLEVSLIARVAPQGVSSYSLRRYPTPPPADDDFAVAVTESAGTVEVDTGLATFGLDPASPALLATIAIAELDDGVGRTQVYSHVAGAGPRLTFDASGDVALSTAGAGEVSVDPDGFEIVASGPVKAVVAVRGHFSAPGGASLCTAVVPSYERFGYTAVFTFVRGSRHLLLRYHLRNECSDAFFPPWTDDEVTVREASWELPFGLAPGAESYVAGGGAVSAAGMVASVAVEQRRGDGSPWSRRAAVEVAGAEQETGEAFASPLVALGDGSLLVAAQMPWMRYREPQALRAAGATLSLLFVGETLVLGEGKGIWNLARVGLYPDGLLGGSVPQFLESVRERGLDELERGLLVREVLDDINRSAIFPSLGTATPSGFKSAYEATLEQLHDETTQPGGPWDRGKIYGSQLWPDTIADPYAIGLQFVDQNDAGPNFISAAMNYWDPAGVELLEFLRTGDPKWSWEFALPAAWLQLVSAYLNLGAHEHGNRGGLAVTSGGPGCELDPDTFDVTSCTADGTAGGEWHRTGLGSDDYTYDMGMDLAYVLRPDPALRDRFAAAGTTVVNRYAIAQADQADRQQFIDQVDPTRQVVQHFEMLANCAEFVPGARGQACHDRLMAIVGELVEENLSAGVICQGDVDPISSAVTSSFCGAPQAYANHCSVPQQFMQNALMYPFFHRLYRNYGDPATGSLRKVLVEAPRTLYEHGIARVGNTAEIDVFGDWWPVMECELSGDRSQVLDCVAAPDSDLQCAMYAFSKPHTAALLLMAHETDPTIALCQSVKQALDQPGLLAAWNDNVLNGAGWWKGASQMMQGMAFAVGIYDTCADPPPP